MIILPVVSKDGQVGFWSGWKRLEDRAGRQRRAVLLPPDDSDRDDDDDVEHQHAVSKLGIDQLAAVFEDVLDVAWEICRHRRWRPRSCALHVVVPLVARPLAI